MRHGPTSRKRHVERLIASFGCKVEYSNTFEYHTGTKVVYLKRNYPRTQEGYLCALHEFGHFACGHGKPDTWNEEANMELAAWGWALRMCEEPLPWDLVKRTLGWSILPSLEDTQVGVIAEGKTLDEVMDSYKRRKLAERMEGRAIVESVKL